MRNALAAEPACAAYAFDRQEWEEMFKRKWKGKFGEDFVEEFDQQQVDHFDETPHCKETDKAAADEAAAVSVDDSDSTVGDSDWKLATLTELGGMTEIEM